MHDRSTDGWPGVGDPNVVGWLAFAAYLVTAYLCLRASRATRRDAEAPHARAAALWLGLAAALFALGLNKQLDLHVVIPAIGRRVARAQGWYEERRTVQVVFTALVGIAGVLLALVAYRLARPQLRSLWPALSGTGLLVGFVFVRAASFHHVDVLFAADRPEGRAIWMIELAGIACVAWCAAATLRRHPPQQQG